MDQAQSQQYLQYFLSQLAWQHDEVRLFGKHYVTARKVVWYGDAHYQYRYSGTLKQAQLWTPGLLRLKQHIEQLVGHPFNSCLANLYEDGSQGCGQTQQHWKHSIGKSSKVLTPRINLTFRYFYP